MHLKIIIGLIMYSELILDYPLSLPPSLPPSDFFSSNRSLSQDIISAVSRLRADSDRDVRFFSGNYEEVSRVAPPTSSPTTPLQELDFNQRRNNESEREEDENKLDIASKCERKRKTFYSLIKCGWESCCVFGFTLRI